MDDCPQAVFELKIDGVETPHLHLDMLAQDDPYPGGHSYCLRVECKMLAELLYPKFPPMLQNPLSKGEALKLFGYVRMIVSLMIQAGRMEHRDTRFYANTVERLSIDRVCIEISGICSPVSSGCGRS